MTDLLRPEAGARPWLPASDVTEVLTLNEYNIPLAGLLERGESTYLYACLFGELEDVNIWAYALLDGAEIERLSTLTGDALADAIRTSLENRMLIVALAFDHELADWLPIDAGIEGPLGLTKRFLSRMRTHLQVIQRGIDELASQRELAST